MQHDGNSAYIQLSMNTTNINNHPLIEYTIKQHLQKNYFHYFTSSVYKPTIDY